MSSDAIKTCINPKGGLDINLQDQTTQPILLQMHTILGAFSLDGEQSIDSFVLNVVTGHGATAGELVCIQEYDDTNKLPRFFMALIKSVTTDTFVLDRPLDYNFGVGTVLCSNRVNSNIANAVGTNASPVLYSIAPLSGKWDITRLIIQVFTAATMDDGKFGSIAKLANGLLFRYSDGFTYNLFNIKSNGAWSSVGYDTKYVDKPPAGTGNGFAARLTFAGQDKIGVAIRLDSAKSGRLDVILSDDLSAFGDDDVYLITAEGHIVD